MACKCKYCMSGRWACGVCSKLVRGVLEHTPLDISGCQSWDEIMLVVRGTSRVNRWPVCNKCAKKPSYASRKALLKHETPKH